MKTMLFLAVVFVLALAGCGGDELVGTWFDVDFPDSRMELNSDGTGVISIGNRSSAITWAVDGDLLCITYDDGSSGCDKIVVDGDRMTREMEGLGFVTRYERWVGE